ncbi:MAG: cyclic nucleotide-binding domain-containing protein [Anaerolineales bacterium]|nr:cyclic nucleotide-binding domain-containing protein [Anaerolineales bacterium]
MSVEFLRRLPLFAGLSEPDLERLAAEAQTLTLPPNTLMIEEGEVGDALYVLLDGELQISKRAASHDVKVDVRRPGDVIGEMSLLDHSPRSASVRTLRESRLLMISKDVFERVLSGSPTAALAILHTVMGRLRQNEALLHEKEKMAGLGTLAAGLAHELNNPAAAVRRAAAQLGEALPKWQAALSALDRLPLSPRQQARLAELRGALAERAAHLISLDPLTRSDREGAVEGWLSERGVAEAWELAPTLVDVGWGPDDLDGLGKDFSPAQIIVLAQALGLGSAVSGLLDEVSAGSSRISEIVKAVKSYSYLDRAPVQEVNVREGLDNTLVILRHKLKAGVMVTRRYAPNLPPIEAFAGELNQVWTNIIDNAVDALAQQPGAEITITTRLEGDMVVVELADNGPGIPVEIQSRVFEPFFTTKPPGVGTGLGLNIAYNIVHKHYGDIRLTSRPGYTCFQVRLPLRLPPA